MTKSSVYQSALNTKPAFLEGVAGISNYNYIKIRHINVYFQVFTRYTMILTKKCTEF